MSPIDAPRPADLLSRLLLGAAVLLGASRLVRLGEWSLWIDEVFTLTDCLHGETARNPLGYFLVSLFLEAFPGRPDEFALRLLPALLGWLGIPLCYWAFRPFVGARVAAAAALLLAASSWHAYWSQNARFYTLAQDLALVGGGLSFRGLRRESFAWSGLGLAFFVASASAHPSGAFLLPAAMAAPLMLSIGGIEVPGSRGRVGRVLFGLAALSALLGLASLALQRGWLYNVWAEWRAAKGTGGSPLHLILTSGFYVTPLLGAGAGVGALVALARRSPWSSLVLGITLLTFAQAAGASLFARVSAQYVFVLLPWIAVLAATPLALLEERPGGSWGFSSAWLALLALPAVATLGLYLSVRQGERPRWRDAYAYVWNERGPEDLILGMSAPVGEYYLNPEETRLRTQRHVAYLDRYRAGTPLLWDRQGRRVWFVLNLEELADWEEEDRVAMERLLREECRLAKAFPLVVESRDLSVWVFVRDPVP